MAEGAESVLRSVVLEPFGEGVPISFHNRKVWSVVTEEIPQHGANQDQPPEKSEETTRPDKDIGGNFLWFRFLGRLFFATGLFLGPGDYFAIRPRLVLVNQ